MRILCFHLNQVGDLAFSLPALKCIRDSFPDSHIVSVVRPGLAGILNAAGLVDEVLLRHYGANLSKLKLIRHLRTSGYDLAIVFSQSTSCALLAWLSRARRRIGFAETSLGFLLTSRVEFHHPPSSENNLRLVEAAGCQISCRDYSGLLRPTQEQIDRANGIMSDHGIADTDAIAVLAPGTSGRRRVKEWTDEGFAAVGSWLAGRGITPVILGTEPASGIVNECDEITDLSGKTNLGEAAAIVSRARLMVGVDSGILHLGAAVETPVIGLYGPSNPAITGPQGEGHAVLTSGADCSPCMKTECTLGRVCMLNLSVGQVTAAVNSMLGGQKTDRSSPSPL